MHMQSIQRFAYIGELFLFKPLINQVNPIEINLERKGSNIRNT